MNLRGQILCYLGLPGGHISAKVKCPPATVQTNPRDAGVTAALLGLCGRGAPAAAVMGHKTMGRKACRRVFPPETRILTVSLMV